MDYRVALDIYKGPLDLLLYLIQESELDIYDIPIATITDQYMKYLGLIQMMDPNIAGDFLVMAATLMEIKSRMLLPQAESAEGEQAEGDPRIELIRQLMEYKKFKEAAAALAERRADQLDRFGRAGRQDFPDAPREPDAVEMSEVSIWDLLSAFERMMRETLRLAPKTIVDRDVPVRQHVEMILRMLRVQGVITFLTIFETCEDRIEAIGALLALLEMTRAKIIHLEQAPPPQHGKSRSETPVPGPSTILVKLVDERNVEKLLQEISEKHVGMAGAPETNVSNETGAQAARPEPAVGETPPAQSQEEPPAEETPAEEPPEEPLAVETPARTAPADEPEPEEEPDEEIEEIRRIEIKEVNLDGQQTEPDSATEERTEDAPLAQEPPGEAPGHASPDAGPPKGPVAGA